ncbi:MAG: HD domain-containing protein [Clostridia bacterium]|nr:HD domain-containing protein [Clostridia bacterium]
MVAEITKKMIDFSEGNLHLINHFMKVHGYAKTIGQLENLDEKTQLTLDVATLVHDIAIPLCREKYGTARGDLQEKEGCVLARDFLQGTGLDDEIIERVAFLVGHHHTTDGVDSLDWQILLEADYLVNADEGAQPKEKILEKMENMFKTKSGIALLKSMYSKVLEG